MWNSLKSDFSELVSVVKEDTNVVLADVNESKRNTEINNEINYRIIQSETFTCRLDDAADTTDPDSAENGEEDAIGKRLNEEQQIELHLFRTSFQISGKTDEIADVLKENEALKEQFENLVPEHVKYGDFWERYYYRCDASRIETEMEEENKQHQQARAELVGNVSNFLGGAVKSVSNVASSIVEETGNVVSKAAAATATTRGINAVSTTAKPIRPPFVMNTVVDDDDDYEEEEELGWDDDEDDDGDDIASTSTMTDNNNASNDVSNMTSMDSNEEQIVFQDEALAKVTEQLKQTEMELDQLVQTIELQRNEILLLKRQPATDADDMNNNASEATSISTEQCTSLQNELKSKNEELVTMQKQLKEEIQLRASAEAAASAAATSEQLEAVAAASKESETTALLQQQIEQLMSQNSDKDNEIHALQSQFQQGNEQEKEQQRHLKQESEQKQQQEIKEIRGKYDTERATLQKQFDVTSKELIQTKSELQQSQATITTLQQSQQQHDATPVPKEDTHSDSTGESSGVNVPVESKTDGGGDDEGWGDDWD